MKSKTLKIFSWNVNGFRSILKKNFMGFLEEFDPDVLCLQEVRSEWEEIDVEFRRQILNEYDVCWFPSSIKKGYSGTAVFSRKSLLAHHQSGVGDSRFDDEGRIINTFCSDLHLISGYFPNASSELKRLDYKRAFSKLLCKNIKVAMKKNKNLIVVGDLNVAPEPIDLANPNSNHSNPGFTPEEREDFKEYISLGLIDIHRDRHQNTPEIYTWWSNRTGARARNVGWRIDIFLLSRSLIDRITETTIHSKILGSDHCPISIEIKNS